MPSDHMFSDPEGHRGRTRVSVTYAELYGIVVERLQYIRPDTDLDAATQNICCEVEKKQGIYPNVPDLTPED